MTAHRTILVPLDGSTLSQQSLALVQTLMNKTTEVHLVQVVPQHRGYLPMEIEMEYGWSKQIEFIVARHAQEELEAFAKRLGDSNALGMVPTVHVPIGDPADTIIDMAREVKADLIVMTTHGHGAIKRVLFGSVADRVVRYSPVPVLVMRPGGPLEDDAPASIQRIVVPLDGSPLAERALPVVTTMATQLGVPVLLVRAIHLDFVVPRVDGTFLIPQESIDCIQRFAQDYLSAIRDHLVQEGIVVSIAAEWGTPFEIIDELSANDDLIVMTSHGRGGVGRWLLGSVAEKLVRSAKAPVLLVPVRKANETR